MDVIPYNTDDIQRNSCEEKLTRKPHFSNSVSLMVWTLRFLGCLPDFRKPSTPLRVMLILYSAAVMALNLYFACHFFSNEPMPDYYKKVQKFNMKSHEKFYLHAATRANFVYMSVIQVLYWCCAKNIYNHFNDWVNFEKLYCELTNEDLFLQLKKKAIIYQLIVTVLNIFLSVAQFHPFLNVQVRPELAMFFFSLLRYTDVLFLILMKAGSLSANRLSKLYINEFKHLKEESSRQNKNRLAQYEALWLKLSELIRGTGNAMASVMFIHIIRHVVLGLFFSYIFWVRLLVLLQEAEIYLILVSWAIEISITYFFLWITTTSAHETQLQVNGKILI